jgi:hypothetical protein
MRDSMASYGLIGSNLGSVIGGNIDSERFHAWLEERIELEKDQKKNYSVVYSSLMDKRAILGTVVA